jgi:hypothetical protein
MSENTQDIEIVSTALVNFDKVAAGLGALEKQYGGVVFDVETPRGMAAAKEARQAIRKPRYDIENIRKAAKAPLLAIGKRLDSEAQRITAELMKLEDPINDQIKNEETRKDREKAEAEAKEAARVAAIQGRITAIRNMAMIPSGSASAVILARHDEVKALSLDGFEELTGDATTAKEQTVAILFGLHSSAVAAEAEAAKIAAERAELARLRAEQEAREAEARKAQEAEQARQAEELRRQREQLERERAEQEKAAKAERDRIAAEAAQQAAEAKKAREEADRIAAEERRKADEAAAAERARQQELIDAESRRLQQEKAAREAEQKRLAKLARAQNRPTDAELFKVLAEHFDVEVDVVRGWLSTLEISKAA